LIGESGRERERYRRKGRGKCGEEVGDRKRKTEIERGCGI
jgi:hypothetical protein